MDKRIIILTSWLFSSCLIIADGSEAAKNSQPNQRFEAAELYKLSNAEREEWINSSRSKLTMAKRQKGPFGLSQDPGREVQAPKPKVAKRDYRFLNAIKALKINGVQGKKFIIGAQEYRQGQRVPLKFQQYKFNVKVVSVSRKGIIFLNTATGERIKHDLGRTPNGVRWQDRIDNVPGVEPANDQPAPIEVNE